MKLEKLSALAEILSAIAILITLVYLAVQTRQNTLAVEAATRQATLDNVFDLLSQVMEDPDIWLSLVKDELTETERVKVSAYLFSVMERTQASWFQYRAGALDEQSWSRVREPTAANILLVQGNRWWNYFQDGFDPEFRDHMNDIVSGQPIETELGESEAFN